MYGGRAYLDIVHLNYLDIRRVLSKQRMALNDVSGMIISIKQVVAGINLISTCIA